MRKLTWLAIVVVVAESTARLYEGKTTAVIELSAKTFNSTVGEDPSSTQWVITYYAHWCGHCQHFAPEFIKIAESFRHESVVKFGAIDCADEMASFGGHDICRQQDIRAYPTVLVYQHGERKQELAKVPSDLLSDVQKLVGSPPDLNRDTDAGLEASPSAEPPQVQPPEPASHEHPKYLVTEPLALIADASLTLYKLLRNDIFKGNTETLQVGQVRDLENLLAICNQTLLPPSVRDACSNMAAAVATMRKSGKDVDRPAWLALLEAQMGEPKQYLSCKDFSCGMWRLLHLVTLSSNPSDHPNGYSAISPLEAMESTKFIVDKYFSCDVCRTHFLGHFEACDFGRCAMEVDSINVPVWLSRLHNGVNARLNKSVWPNGAALADPVVTYNELRSQYGLEPIAGPASWPTVVWLVLVLVIVAGLASFRSLTGTSTLLNRIKFSLTKKYHPIDIV